MSIIGPRANFACNSRKCRTEDGASPVYELPVAARTCPVCGSRRIQRLFDKVNISTEGHNIARRVDGITQQAWEEQRASQVLARDATSRWGPLKVVPTRAVPQALANTFGEFGAPHIANQVAASAGQQFRPVGGKPAPEVVPTGDVPVRTPPAPAVGSKIDRRYRRPTRE